MYSHKSHRPTWVEININALRSNYHVIESQLGEGTSILGVVKADAYGHGALEITNELIKLGVEYLAVSNIDEAIELREGGITCPILLFGTVDSPKFGKLIQYNIYPTVTSYEYAKMLVESYKYRGIYPKVHIKIDTGMGRLGIPYEDALLEIEQISRIDGLILDGIYSHFPSSDDDIEYSREQLSRFISLINEIKNLKIRIKHYHIANSSAIFNLPETTQEPFTMVRPGLALYGYSDDSNSGLENTMSLKSRVLDIRKMKKGSTISYHRTYTVKDEYEYIAILPVGYADGIPTMYSNLGKIYINGHPYTQVGRICMDYMMLSLGNNDDSVQVGDVATIFGNSELSVESFGEVINKIPYEVTCSITKRVPRIYLRKEDERKDIE